MEDKIVLLVEDNPDDVTMILRSFRWNNILNQVVVRDGAEALDYLFRSRSYSRFQVTESGQRRAFA